MSRSVSNWLLLGLWVCLASFLSDTRAAEVDVSKLPPAASSQVDFARDIKPILEVSCLRCHGPEKPKNHFRLDSKEAALKGGDNGVDIISGDSTNSPLIHYVGYLVEDSEMPPVGKGDRLSATQVALLRAWINQGVPWETIPKTNEWAALFDTSFGGTAVTGNKQKFREQLWHKEGPRAGVNQFEVFEGIGDTKFYLSGHAYQDDYAVGMLARRNDLGFIRTGWSQYRKYFDDLGGFFPATNAAAMYDPNDLHLDVGKAWIDFGLTLPNWPQMVFGYEYDYRRGEKSTLNYGAYQPSAQEIHEGVHIIKFDLNAEVQGFTLEDQFRGEFYNLHTEQTNYVAPLARSGPPRARAERRK